MWTALLSLALASCCLAAPQQQPSVDELIGDIFSSPQTTGVPENKATGNSLNALVSGYLNEQSSTAPTTYVGSQNSPPPNPGNCECIAYYLCRNGTTVVDGLGLIDIRSNFDDNSTTLEQKLGKTCVDYLDVCCKPPDKYKPDEVPKPPPKERIGCGQRNPEGVGFRITGDKNNETKFGEFPWMVAIIKDEIISQNQLSVYQCGGSLIHKQAVLTAAHCVHGKEASTLKIRAGEWDTQTRNEIFPHQDRTVEKVIVHESYYPGALYYDVAILILKEPVDFAENVDIVCLPDPETVYDHSRCFATGWGKDKFGKEGHYQVILKKVDLPVVPRDTCQDSLRQTRLGKYFQLHESFICAGGEPGKDTCKGDGGSPLVCPSKKNPSRYEQAGIVAWGIGCGENGTPGVYANMAYVRDWIDNKMVYNNLDNTVYSL